MDDKAKALKELKRALEAVEASAESLRQAIAALEGGEAQCQLQEDSTVMEQMKGLVESRRHKERRR